MTHSADSERLKFGSFIEEELKSREEFKANSKYFEEMMVFGAYPGEKRNGSFLLSSGNERFLNHEKSLCLISNSQEFCRVLEPLVLRAEYMFKNEAYVHHFSNFGISKSFIKKSLAIVRYIIHIYQQI